MKVQIIMSSYNGVNNLEGVFNNEEKALKCISELLGIEIKTVTEFGDWQYNEMTDEKEVHWFEKEVEQTGTAMQPNGRGKANTKKQKLSFTVDFL